MSKAYIVPDIRHVEICFRNSLLTVGIGSIGVKSFKDGGHITAGGDVASSRMTVGGDLDDEEDETEFGRRTLWDTE